ncbi:PAS domain-containing sensor histidine kinase [Telmatospirillum sp. J64-1]|uniref:sensor histidine kinase NtrY-like n=1 Tax=Telmatospirillum sp. J64-1 TaxID=2502183 RepID=UPI002104F574|nr:PAS domain-containing sensor histidine kinase [Telmatospirillum sp. J64-1]
MVVPIANSSLRRFVHSLALWSRQVGLGRKLAIALMVAAILSGFLTYGAFAGWLPYAGPTEVLILLNIDLVLLLALGAIVARRLVRIWVYRRSGSAGSRLHVRLVFLFSLVAVTPTILMTVFSALFFNFGLQTWFSERVRTALEESKAVAVAYLEEHQRVIVGDLLAMANDINREGPELFRSREALNQIVSSQAAIRALTEAVVFDSERRVLARSGFSFAIEMSIDTIPYWALERAARGDVPVMTTDTEDRVRALVQLGGDLSPIYLYVGRFIDPKVVGHVDRAASAVAEFERLEGNRSDIEITFTMIFVLVALLLLLAAVWVGLSYATQLARPIADLIDAAERVRAGDLGARVGETAADELGSLGRAFNRMTQQLDSQRRDLIEANRELDERRRFTETVLAGVSAGVIGLDTEARVHLPNRSAAEFLEMEPEAMTGLPLSELLPEAAELVETVMRRPDRPVQAELRITRQGRPRTLLVRLASERLGSEVVGYVATFDDITELLSAQRKAAWADVARRIAHEIKNPLTPIQLSAERLKRKYLKEIQSDPETFVTCADTIIRQVGDIGRMVDEFSSFARMPAPVMKQADLGDLVRQTVFLTRNGYPDVAFETELPAGKVELSCDIRLIGQALTNLLKNSVEAIQGRKDADAPPGLVRTRLVVEKDHVAILVEDNGKGLPKEERDRLTEPYVTTRAKGTGLGLAIVKKIMEDHGGGLILEDMPEGGARVGLIFTGPDMVAMTATTEAEEASHGA